MQTAGKKKVFEFCICGFEGTVYHCIYSSLAQSVEHAAVNRSVVGSSPTGGVFWLHGQAVKTPPFHGGNRGSNPLGVIQQDKCGLSRIYR